MIRPELIKAGDARVKLGYKSEPPKVDCRVVVEDEYQRMLSMIKSAYRLMEDGAPYAGHFVKTVERAQWRIEIDKWGGLVDHI